MPTPLVLVQRLAVFFFVAIVLPLVRIVVVGGTIVTVALLLLLLEDFRFPCTLAINWPSLWRLASVACSDINTAPSITTTRKQQSQWTRGNVTARSVHTHGRNAAE